MQTCGEDTRCGQVLPEPVRSDSMHLLHLQRIAFARGSLVGGCLIVGCVGTGATELEGPGASGMKGIRGSEKELYFRTPRLLRETNPEGSNSSAFDLEIPDTNPEEQLGKWGQDPVCLYTSTEYPSIEYRRFEQEVFSHPGV